MPQNTNTRVAPSVSSSSTLCACAAPAHRAHAPHLHTMHMHRTRTPCACTAPAHHVQRSAPACTDEHLQHCAWGPLHPRPPLLQEQMAQGSRAHMHTHTVSGTCSATPVAPIAAGSTAPAPRSNRKWPGAPVHTHV
ncbi:hypothetical protein B0H14DRAFT_3491928 [Mycena olivaceomarginata]|nr:hypothetical protein B0H14DRAFT_3491928 [Mycena olivaceomarginata]